MIDLDKVFLKSFLTIFENESFTIEFWDKEEIKLGEGIFRCKINGL